MAVLELDTAVHHTQKSFRDSTLCSSVLAERHDIAVLVAGPRDNTLADLLDVERDMSLQGRGDSVDVSRSWLDVTRKSLKVG